MRYRWPDAFRDEVLARLMALNAERARAEAEAREAKEEAERAAKVTRGGKRAKGVGAEE